MPFSPLLGAEGEVALSTPLRMPCDTGLPVPGAKGLLGLFVVLLLAVYPPSMGLVNTVSPASLPSPLLPPAALPELVRGAMLRTSEVGCRATGRARIVAALAWVNALRAAMLEASCRSSCCALASKAACFLACSCCASAAAWDSSASSAASLAVFSCLALRCLSAFSRRFLRCCSALLSPLAITATSPATDAASLGVPEMSALLAALGMLFPSASASAAPFTPITTASAVSLPGASAPWLDPAAGTL
mmetsp:Transcript_20334/g.61266  ORF Transcript_20334/g.61266 Transcript_20334/m.61266 type:complete len:247 (+) Transcript_20334:719-1459(+)